MGYGLQKFVSSIDENLLCGICSLVLEDAVLTPCGHSFCKSCLHTWLSKPGCLSCPECRGRIFADDAIPVRAIRNLVNAMDTRCLYGPRGCKVITRLEEIKAHSDTCPFAPVECTGCLQTFNRQALSEHHLSCEAIAAAVGEDGEKGSRDRMLALLRKSQSHPQELVSRVSTLELHVRRLKRDLDIADIRNKQLERELKKAKEELEDKRKHIVEQQYAIFDPEYEYGYSPQSIASLACLISRFLQKKPPYIERDRIFDCIRRCYENYARCGNKYEHGVHMLVATAYGSNWFTENQKLNFHCWLQCIARHRQWAFNLEFNSVANSTEDTTQ